MSKGSKYKPGQVIYAEAADRKVGPKDRPWLIIHPGAEDKRQPLCCLAVSTRAEIDPNDPSLDIAWDAVTGDTTGLYKPSAVVLLWHVLIQQIDVRRVSGIVTQAYLSQVIQAREFARLHQHK